MINSLLLHRFYWGSLAPLLLLLLAGCQPVTLQTDATTTIDIYHFSDYHSHALPGFAEGDASRGGIARVLGLLATAKASNPNLLAFNGGDMMNLSNPIWSDVYTCTEWSWFNSVVDGMALGNHEFDYGGEAFSDCANHITYPLLSSGLVYSDTAEPYLPEYEVYEVDGVRIGVFAVAGDDFPRIVRPELMPANMRWLIGEEKLARAAAIVETLRNAETADLVISIGHQSRLEDEVMARRVAGIDLILGTHSHLKVPLTQIEGTTTYFISPFQYLDYVSHVTLGVADGQLVNITGELIAIDETTAENVALAEKVMGMQAELEELHPERFEILGEAAGLIDNTDVNWGETGIGNFVTDLARQAVNAHVFLSTSSSFRAALPPGPITQEAYLTALPYQNSIVTAELSGAQLLELLTLSATKRGSDAFSQISGVRYTLHTSDNSVSHVQVLADPADPTAGYVDLDPTATYFVATTNFQAQVAADYKDIFASAQNVINTEIDINALVSAYIRANSPVAAEPDGRISIAD